MARQGARQRSDRGKGKEAAKATPPAERHNAAFVVGSVVGGLAGAAAALWTTPKSGEELRRQLAGGGRSADVTTVRVAGSETEPVRGSAAGAPLSGRVLSFVERAAAPIVGVKLGQTANGSGPGSDRVHVEGGQVRTVTAATTTTDSGTAGQPTETITFDTYSGRSQSPTVTTTTTSSVTNAGMTASATEGAGQQLETSAPATPAPSPASSAIPEGTPGHVPSTSELVTPVNPAVSVDEAAPARDIPDEHKAFPDFDDTKRS